MNHRTAVIIGGGVTGLSTAYQLALRHYGRVILMDKGPIGSGSSSRAAGIITGLLWTPAGVLARKKALQLFRDLSEELEGYQFQDVGCLNLFDPESWSDRERELPMYRSGGAPFEILDVSEIRRRWPALNPDENYTGLFDPRGGYSEPDEYLPALTKRCRELGVEIREGQKVSEFLMENGVLRGVRTADGPVEADAVAATVYSWTHRVLEPLEIRLPVKAFVHQRWVTAPLPQPVRIPAVNANPLGGYFRPASGCRFLAGLETPDRNEFRVPSSDFEMGEVTLDPALRAESIRRFEKIVPAVQGVPAEIEKVGLLTFSMDGEPILGPIKAVPGLYVGLAFHSGGFAYNPVSGLLLAEYIADGRTSIDVSSFSPDRFDPDAVDAYLGSTVPQSAAFRRRH